MFIEATVSHKLLQITRSHRYDHSIETHSKLVIFDDRDPILPTVG